MSESLESVKKTIRDLLNLARNDAATEGEIDNAIRFARRLMDRHHIDEDDCHDPHTAAAVEELMDCGENWLDNQFINQWEHGLAWFVRNLVGSVGHYINRPQTVRKNGVLVFNANGKPRVASGFTFYGPAEDVVLATELFDNLRQTVIVMARLKHGGAMQGPGRSYAEGFVAGMSEKLSESRRADESASAESRALIVRSTALAKVKQEKAKNWLATAKGIKLRNRSGGGGGGQYHGNAYGEGRADGRKADVSATRKSKIDGSSQRRLN